MRGILRKHKQTPISRRFIPADAGNTGAKYDWLSLLAVHPRGCGEYSTRAERFLPIVGSSPRMRGIRDNLPEPYECVRFIPADAGNTMSTHSSSSGLPVHPRGCGEYVCGDCKVRLLCGSSPRMRGIHLIRGLKFLTFPVHPRGCGEYQPVVIQERAHRGSSPRMRGILSGSGFQCGGTRFIPADAGNTYRKDQHRRVSTVHPRGCGEYE